MAEQQEQQVVNDESVENLDSVAETPVVCSKPLPLGIQNFKQIIQKGFHYVDKTRFAATIIRKYPFSFLSRPRRFGKSVFVSTLKSILLEERSLFSGLKIGEDWPVNSSEKWIVLNFPSTTEETIKFVLTKLKANNGIDPALVLPMESLFELIHEKTGRQFAVLIDEYDKAVTDAFTGEMIRNERQDKKLISDSRMTLKRFFEALKASGSNGTLGFLFCTGCTQFVSAGLFSGANWLTDLTLRSEFNGICGFTKEEMEGIGLQETPELRQWYNGYKWGGANTVYNPINILEFLSTSEFKSYWYQTGKSSYIWSRLFFENQCLNIKEKEIMISFSDLSPNRIGDLKTSVLLLQAGYLTVDRIVHRIGNSQIWLKCPNLEVEFSFFTEFLSIFGAEVETSKIDLFPIGWTSSEENLKAAKDIMYNQISSVFPHLNCVALAKAKEQEYAMIVHAILVARFPTVVTNQEDTTSLGRIDLSVVFPGAVLIIEFKLLNDKAKPGSALQQIKEKKYCQKFENRNLPIVMMGIEFRENFRNVDTVEIEQYRFEKDEFDEREAKKRCCRRE